MADSGPFYSPSSWTSGNGEPSASSSSNGGDSGYRFDLGLSSLGLGIGSSSAGSGPSRPTGSTTTTDSGRIGPSTSGSSVRGLSTGAILQRNRDRNEDDSGSYSELNSGIGSSGDKDIAPGLSGTRGHPREDSDVSSPPASPRLKKRRKMEHGSYMDTPAGLSSFNAASTLPATVSSTPFASQATYSHSHLPVVSDSHLHGHTPSDHGVGSIALLSSKHKRDKQFYLEDGSCVLLVQDTLFNVHSSPLSTCLPHLILPFLFTHRSIVLYSRKITPLSVQCSPSLKHQYRLQHREIHRPRNPQLNGRNQLAQKVLPIGIP
jgi:hypothetical protein